MGIVKDIWYRFVTKTVSFYSSMLVRALLELSMWYKRWSTCPIVSMFESGRCPNGQTIWDNRRPPVKLYETGKGVGMHPADILLFLSSLDLVSYCYCYFKTPPSEQQDTPINKKYEISKLLRRYQILQFEKGDEHFISNSKLFFIPFLIFYFLWRMVISVYKL